MAKAASAETTPVRRKAAARVETARVLPWLSPPFLSMEIDVAVRALGPMVVKAAEEPRQRAAAVRTRVDFMVMLFSYVEIGLRFLFCDVRIVEDRKPAGRKQDMSLSC